MRVLGFIGARGGSKGIARKNLVELDGNPLLYYTLTEAKQSNLLDRVVLSTDDVEIAALGTAVGVEVPFLRPTELATDSAALSAAIQHTLDWLKANDNYTPDAILLLQPTSPLRRMQHIDEAILLYQKENADTLISLSHPQEHPWDMVYFEDGEMKFALNKSIELTNRQDYRQCQYINGAIYITRLELFTKYQNFFSGKIVPYMMSTIDSIDIDSEADLTIADCLLKRRRQLSNT